MAVLVAFAVAYRQAYPQGALKLPAGLALDAKDVPVFTVALLAALAALRVTTWAPMMLATYGFLASWTYLRFYQRREAVQGDASDAFAFEEFLPAPLQCVGWQTACHVATASGHVPGSTLPATLFSSPLGPPSRR